jgi:NAD(P)-dependent dehydrogenase (short-subunit alcohol dehydrogenase family)
LVDGRVASLTVFEAGLTGRAALITGGGRGIGRAVALAFARAGVAVAVAARSVDEIEEVAGQCRAIGVPAVALPLDVTDSAACSRQVDRCREALGRIDILVNNAGVARSSKFLDTPDDLWQRTLDVDLTAAFRITRAVLPEMLSRSSGSVIAVASIAGRVGAPYIAAYAAAKHGLVGLMRSLAAEYAGTGVTFNSVCPAYVDTPMTEAAIRTIMERTGRTRDESLRLLVTPQGRLIQPEEVASMCVYLASPDARSITGQAINIDGGAVQS